MPLLQIDSSRYVIFSKYFLAGHRSNLSKKLTKTVEEVYELKTKVDKLAMVGGRDLSSNIASLQTFVKKSYRISLRIEEKEKSPDKFKPEELETINEKLSNITCNLKRVSGFVTFKTSELDNDDCDIAWTSKEEIQIKRKYQKVEEDLNDVDTFLSASG